MSKIPIWFKGLLNIIIYISIKMSTLSENVTVLPQRIYNIIFVMYLIH